MEWIPRGIYVQEIREQAVHLHEVDWMTMPEVVQRPSFPEGAEELEVSGTK